MNVTTIPFKPARYVDGVRKYIVFYTWDGELGKLIRLRDFQPEKIKNPIKRAQWVEKMIEVLNELLEEGYHRPGPQLPPVEAIIKDDAMGSLLFHLEDLIAVRKNSLRLRSWETERNLLKRVTEFFHHAGITHLPAGHLEKRHVIEFSDWLLRYRGITPRTRNNYIESLRALLNELKERGKLKDNPASGIKALRFDISIAHRPFSTEQRETLWDYFKKENPALYLFTRIIYYTFARPHEIIYLRVENIRLKERTIFIPASVSKNRRDGTLHIFQPLLNDLVHFPFSDAQPDHWLISKSGLPGKFRMADDAMGRMHREALQKLEMTAPGLSLYSWKHTAQE